MAYTAIDDPSAYFGTTLYTGNETVRAITFDGNSDLDVDWIWLKSRSATGNHHLYDSVRGTQKHLRTNLNSAEGTNSGTDGVTAFSSNGVTIGTNTASNANNVTFVGWGWKAGTSFTNDASSTSIGSIDSAGSVNTDAGFSICSFTGNGTGGASVKHGLSTKPAMMIIKNRDEADSWQVYHHKNTSAPATETLQLNETGATVDTANRWNDTEPTTAILTLGDNPTVNKNGIKYIVYIFSEKQGYSKFGSYTANANADGTFVYTGFKPAFLLIKNTSQATDWIMYDNKRLGFEPQNKEFATNGGAVEANAEDNYVQFSANGFKTRNTGTKTNADAGDILIYMAFAEQPLVTSTGIPATAR